mmetsp:Transcript_33007/g.78061  ORF Transcript_33007/g.78061 Transcript_33007/m.78061 type:complete len:247 (-) Transcript_33007:244-984(-)
MASCTDYLDRCPCLAGLLKPRHANRELESVALVGAGQSPDPDTESPAPSAAAAAWSGFQKIQASVTSTVLGAPDELEPSWQLLCKGATMRLDGPTGPDQNASTALRNELVTLVLTADHGLLTWKTVRLAQSMPVASGAVAMSSVSVEAAARGWFSAPLETALLVVADGQTLSLTAESVAQKEAWAKALAAVAARASEDRHTRKLGHSTRREYEMQAKKREAERRKAEVMGGCTSGMRHTARAMASR